MHLVLDLVTSCVKKVVSPSFQLALSLGQAANATQTKNGLLRGVEAACRLKAWHELASMCVPSQHLSIRVAGCL